VNGIKTIAINDGTTSIGAYAFNNCASLTSVTIPSNVTALGQGSFYNCKALNTVTIEDGATTLTMYSSRTGYTCFSGCPLTTLYIGRNIAPSNTSYSPFANQLAAANLAITFGNQVTAICNYLFDGASSVKSVTIPESVTTIGTEAFAGCGLTSLVIPNSVITVGTSAFANNSSLTSLNIGTKVTTINESAFSGCASLNSLTIPANVTTLGQGSFYNCKALNTATIENSATTLTMYSSRTGYTCFSGCPLTTLYIGRNIAPSTASYSPFANQLAAANLAITFGNQVTAICNYLFDGASSVKSVTIPESVTTIGTEAFAGCGLTSLVIPNSVITVGTSAFTNNSSLTSLNIGTKVSTIEATTFSGCASLTSLTIPANVTTLGQNAFANCKALNTVTIEDGMASLTMYSSRTSNYTCFFGCPLTTLYIGRNIAPSTASYSPFKGELAAANLAVTFGSQVTAICDLLFYGTSSVKSVTIPASVTAIGESAFAGCGLTSLTIPNSVITIGTSAFASNSSLTSLSIGTKVTTINASAFSGCASLTSLTIPVNVTTLGEGAFYNCKDLNAVTIEDGGTTLTMYTARSSTAVFSGCPLTTLYIGRNIAPSNTSYSPFADDLAAANLAVTFGSQVTTVPAQLFNGTTTITQITSKAVVPPTAGTNCFQGVNKTTCKLYVPETALDAYKSANEWKDFFNIYAGINDISTSPISVYPNPVRADLFIKSETPVEKIEIYSLSGNLLLTNYFTDKISVSALPKGVLFVKVYTNQGTVIKKIVKE
jgi:phage FluMu protein Com